MSAPSEAPDRSVRRSLSRLKGWAEISTLDAIGRLLLQVGTTFVLARLLTPEDFGTAAVVLTLMAVAAICVGAPFEEAIAQRRVIRRAHLQTAAAASLLAALALGGLTSLAGVLLTASFDSEAIVWLIPFAGVILLANVPWTIAISSARRRRSFESIALANLLGNAVGTVAAIALALGGAGVWALVAFRVVTQCAAALILTLRLRLWLFPRWSTVHFRELFWFARFSLLARLLDDLVYLVFNYTVAGLYGLAALGFLNMALRVVEPLRGAIVAIVHNLAFAFFVHAGGEARRLAAQVSSTVSHTSFLTTPVFLGLAAVAPLLIAVMAGPGWEPATQIAILLALGCALSTPLQVVVAALNASGRPQFAVKAGLYSSVGMVSVLVLAAPAGAVAAGIARCVGDAVRGAYTVEAAARHLGTPRYVLLGPVAAALGLSGLMALSVVALGGALAGAMPEALLLAILVVAGAAIYSLAIFTLFPSQLRHLARRLAGAPSVEQN